MPFALSELEIGLIGIALTLLVFAIQGAISVWLEGTELRLGRVRPRLTSPLSVAIIVGSGALFVAAVFLGIGIASNWSVRAIGLLAGAGCLTLTALLICYKEAFVGSEATLDAREDGVPW